MSGSDASPQEPLDALIEAFLQRRRAGEAIAVEAYCAAHPSAAAELRELLPTLLALEAHKRERASSGRGQRRARVPSLERLGDFRIVGELGRGGMGVVFEAVQESLDRKVALKVLPQAALLTGNQLERFTREAQIAAKLHHSNIVPVFGSGESDGYHWYAMQFIVGQSLDRWRDEQRQGMPSGSGQWRNRARFVAGIGMQAAAALDHAHGQGTLHRDIKPANLLLEHNDHVWVTDFGLAKALEAEGLTHTGDLLGTLQYMAPEQFAGAYDVRSEVYALGVTLYELLTLQPAFVGGSRSELMERIRTQRPEPLRRRCPELPADLVVIVETAMARDPADRYATAAALAQDLQAFLADRPIAARQLSAVGIAWRWCRRNRGMAALAASTLLGFVGAGITGWVAYGVTDEALARERVASTLAAQQSARAETNLQVTLDAFGKVFDALVGPDPALAFDADEETGEATVVVRSVVEPRDLRLLQEMLAFYDQFAAQNSGNQSLQLETARACRRVGAILARLGGPADLTRAAAAYAQALERLAGLEQRDVRRETAAALVELAQVERRRRRPAEGMAALRRALDLLEAVPEPGKAVRLERAEVLFLLAAEPRGRRGGGRPGERPDRGGDADRQRSREQLQRAMELVDSVLAEDAGHLPARALQARCLLLSSAPAWRPEFARGEGDRSAPHAAAVAILRELVASHPEREDDRFELCRALLATPRREESSRDGRGPRAARELLLPDLALCREAESHAAQLLQRQPLFVEYRRLAASAQSTLGRALAEAALSLTGDERLARLREAEQLLGRARDSELALVAAAKGADGAPPGGGAPGLDRWWLPALLTSRTLVSVHEQLGQRDAAIAEFHRLLDVCEAQLADRMNLGRLLEQFAPRPGPDAGLREQLRQQAARLGDAALLERLRGLLQRIVPPRDDGPPSQDGRRGR